MARQDLVADIQSRTYEYFLRRDLGRVLQDDYDLLLLVRDRIRIRVESGEAPRYELCLFKGLSYDPERDFVPVARVFSPLVLVVQPSVGMKTLKDLIAASQKDPGKWSFGSAGTGSTTYLGVKLLEEKTGAKFLHVPYKGVAPAFQDLLGGQIQFMMPDVTSALQFIKSGKLVPLAVEQRSALLPGVPSFSDAGFQEVNTQTSFSLVAPTGTPAAVVERLHKEWTALTKSPAFVSKLESLGLVPDTENLPGLNASLKKERDFYAAFIKRNGIVASD